jgi:hypothetical protein
MTMADILEINAKTGERIERDRTPEEQAQYETDVAAAAQAEAEYAAAEARLAAARAAAIEHAKGLGFTDEMIAVMYPNLGAQ